MPFVNNTYYKTEYEWTNGTSGTLSFPIVMPLNSIHYSNTKRTIKITVTDQSGNVVSEEKAFHLLTSLTYRQQRDIEIYDENRGEAMTEEFVITQIQKSLIWI